MCCVECDCGVCVCCEGFIMGVCGVGVWNCCVMCVKDGEMLMVENLFVMGMI